MTENNGSMITAIRRHNKIAGQYEVYIDGEYTFSVCQDTLVRNNLLKGKRIGADEIERIVADDRHQKAYMESLRYIARRSRSTHEVRQTLKRNGYDGETIERVISRLTEQNFLDDGKFAQMWTERRISANQYGRTRIQQELRDKGLNRADISRALDGIDPQEELRSAMRAAHKKWRALKATDNNKEQKLLSFLLRRGFPHDVIRKVMQNLRIHSPHDEKEIDV